MFSKTEGLSLTVSENEASNVIKVYYVRKDSNVIVKYIDINTNQPLSDEEEVTGKVFDEYDISNLEKTIEGYTLVEEPDEKTGTFTEETQEKIYYYAKNTKVIVKYLEKDDTEDDSDNTVLATEETIYVNYYYIKQTEVIVEYIDKNTGENIKEVVETTQGATDSTEYIEGHEGDSYKAEEKTFDGYTLVETSNNTEGTMTKDTIYVKYYYVKKSKVIEQHIDVMTGELLETETIHEGFEGDEYSTTYKTFEGYKVIDTKLPENASGKISGSVTYVKYYYVKKSIVRVQFLEIGTEKVLADEEIIEGSEGDSYTTTSKTIDGFTLVTDRLPENSTGVMSSSEIVVIYYYDAGSSAAGETSTLSAITSAITGPSTGDNTPYIALGMILTVVLFNIVQLKIAHKKEACKEIKSKYGKHRKERKQIFLLDKRKKQ